MSASPQFVAAQIAGSSVSAAGNAIARTCSPLQSQAISQKHPWKSSSHSSVTELQLKLLYGSRVWVTEL